MDERANGSSIFSAVVRWGRVSYVSVYGTFPDGGVADDGVLYRKGFGKSTMVIYHGSAKNFSSIDFWVNLDGYGVNSRSTSIPQGRG